MPQPQHVDRIANVQYRRVPGTNFAPRSFILRLAERTHCALMGEQFIAVYVSHHCFAPITASNIYGRLLIYALFVMMQASST